MKKNIFKFGAALTAAMMVFSAAAMLAYAEGDEVPAEPETTVSDVVEAPEEDAEATAAPDEDAEEPEDEETPADETAEVVVPVETEEITNIDIEAAAEVEAAAGQVDADGSVIEIGTISASKAADYYEVSVPFTVDVAPSQMTIFVYDITGLVSGTPDATIGYKAETPVGYINQEAKGASGTWTFKLSTEKYNDDSIIVVKMGGTDVDQPDAASIKLSDAAPAPGVVYGDADKNGEVNGLDAALVMRYFRGRLTDESLIDLEAADAKKDGDVNGLDAAAIMRYFRGRVDSLPL